MKLTITEIAVNKENESLCILHREYEKLLRERIEELEAQLAQAVEALEARLNAIAFLARDGACDMKGRRLDEYYDTQMEVTRDPCGAFMAIESMSEALDAIRRAALAGEKPNE
jgi:hypothetical protein